MIKLQDMTPDVYYNESRDFQLIGRLYDIVLNYVKTNSELINNVPFNDNTDEQLISLLAATLGFKTNKNYNTNQLIAVCSVFSEALQKKGTIESIRLIGNALLNAEGITDELTIEVVNNNISILIPNKLSNINLLKDVLSYVIPAGATVNLIKVTAVNKTITSKTLLQDNVKYKWETTPGTYETEILDTTLGQVAHSEFTTKIVDYPTVENTPSTGPNITVIKPKFIDSADENQSQESANSSNENNEGE